jgi:hypothetical protein
MAHYNRIDQITQRYRIQYHCTVQMKPGWNYHRHWVQKHCPQWMSWSQMLFRGDQIIYELYQQYSRASLYRRWRRKGSAGNLTSDAQFDPSAAIRIASSLYRTPPPPLRHISSPPPVVQTTQCRVSLPKKVPRISASVGWKVCDSDQQRSEG